ncbi:His-Xaa-Ser repeat protein HxsA2 [Cupriavidus basilensis]|uniref:His-Xaa-Ser repeat protein HxsA2 n=1 Tax=Cupriavidus basilensis TaxID=68895 RepID=UPI0012E01B05|nr:His-Xaa-Ser repeat protein HxsA2 [Cupriavidus basilensis]
MKGFLKAFAAVAAGFAAQNAPAMQVPTQDSSAQSSVAPSDIATKERVAVRTQGGDAFSFVLKRNAEEGNLMAYHQSHASHASHASHYSGR